MLDVIVIIFILGIVFPFMIYNYVIKGTIIEDGIKELYHAIRNKNKVSDGKRSKPNRKNNSNRSNKTPSKTKVPNKKRESDRSIPSDRRRGKGD